MAASASINVWDSNQMAIEYDQFDDEDRRILKKVCEAVKGYRNGDPIKDFIDEDEIATALELLVTIVPKEELM